MTREGYDSDFYLVPLKKVHPLVINTDIDHSICNEDKEKGIYSSKDKERMNSAPIPNISSCLNSNLQSFQNILINEIIALLRTNIPQSLRKVFYFAVISLFTLDPIHIYTNEAALAATNNFIPAQSFDEWKKNTPAVASVSHSLAFFLSFYMYLFIIL